MNRWRAVTIDEWIDKYMDLGYNGCLLFFNFNAGVREKTQSLIKPILSVSIKWCKEVKMGKSRLLGNEHRTPSGLCDR